MNHEYTYEQVLYQEGIRELELGRFKTAESKWLIAYSIADNPILLSNICFRLGCLYQRQIPNFLKAMSYFAKATEIRPEFQMAWSYLGYCYQKLGNHQKAMKIYEKSISLNEDQARCYGSLANLYRQQGQLDKALECYQKALEHNERNQEQLYFELGLLYLKKDDFEQAKHCFKKSVTIYPTEGAFKFLAYLYRCDGNDVKANDYLIQLYNRKQMGTLKNIVYKGKVYPPSPYSNLTKFQGTIFTDKSKAQLKDEYALLIQDRKCDFYTTESDIYLIHQPNAGYHTDEDGTGLLNTIVIETRPYTNMIQSIYASLWNKQTSDDSSQDKSLTKTL